MTLAESYDPLQNISIDESMVCSKRPQHDEAKQYLPMSQSSEASRSAVRPALVAGTSSSSDLHRQSDRRRSRILSRTMRVLVRSERSVYAKKQLGCSKCTKRQCPVSALSVATQFLQIPHRTSCCDTFIEALEFIFI